LWGREEGREEGSRKGSGDLGSEGWGDPMELGLFMA